MQPARIIVIAVAAVSAIGLALVVRAMTSGGEPVNQASAAAPAEAPTAQVLVAARDLEVGDRLENSDMDWRAFPLETVNAAWIVEGASAIPTERRILAPAGIRVVRTSGLGGRVQWNLGPPRMRYDEAALDVALATSTELQAVAAVARAVQSRHTTAVRMSEALGNRARAPRRVFLEAVLADVARGTCSVLEREYLERVERPHFLPGGRRQLRVGTKSGVVYRDNAIGELLVELDGRLFHDTAQQRDADHERDLDAAVAGQGTVRLTWGQVVDRPCTTAAKLSRILELKGLPGGRACGPGCAWAEAA